MTASNLPASELWAKTVDRVKDRVNNRSLWETMEKAVGIAVEDGIFIVGLNVRIFNEAGHMTTSEHRNAIEMAASALAGVPLKLRVIEGETLADWAATKKNDVRIAAMREATFDRRDRMQAEAQNWDMVYDYVSRAYSATPMRQLPQAKARYLSDMLYVLSDAMDQLYSEQPDEATERHLARIIDKVATSCEIPSTLIAFELQRLRAWQKQTT